MLLFLSSCQGGFLHERAVQFLGEVPLGAAHGFLLGLPPAYAHDDVVLGPLTAAHAHHDDRMECPVQSPVNTAVESVPAGLA